MVEDCPTFAKNCAHLLKDQAHIFLLGLGLGECVAKEGSLKLKELTYKHCQAYSLNNVGNGFFSYSKENTTNGGGAFAFYIILEDEYKVKSMEFLQFIHAKLGVHIFVISDCKTEADREFIVKNSDN